MTRYLRIDDHQQAMLVVLALRQLSIRATPGQADQVQTLSHRARTLCMSEEPGFGFASILPTDAPNGTYQLIHTEDRRFAAGYALLDRDRSRPLDEIAAQLCVNLSLDPLPRAQPVEHLERRGFRLLGAQACA